MKETNRGKIILANAPHFRQAVESTFRNKPNLTRAALDGGAFTVISELTYKEDEVIIRTSRGIINKAHYQSFPKGSLACVVAHEATELGLMEPKTKLVKLPPALQRELQRLAKILTTSLGIDGDRHVKSTFAEYETAEKREILKEHHNAQVSGSLKSEPDRRIRDVIFEFLGGK